MSLHALAAFPARQVRVHDYPFAFKAIVYTIALSVPLVDFLDIAHSPWLYVFPTYASLLLLEAVFQDISPANRIYAVVMLSLSAGLVCHFAIRQFRHYVFGTRGNEST